MTWRRWQVSAGAAIGLAVVLSNVAWGGGAGLKPRRLTPKPANFVLGPHHNTQAIDVKFREGLTVRLRDGRLNDLGTGALREAGAALDDVANVPGARWRRAARVEEQRLDQLWRRAQENLGRELMNPNLIYRLMLPQGADTGALIDRLNALDAVELAQCPPRQAPPPLPPNFQPQQLYIEAATPGVGAVPCWTMHGVTGAGVRIMDIEYNWLLSHHDLPAVTDVGGDPVSVEPEYTHHGCAALGIMGAVNNGWGTTGIAPDAQYLVASSYTWEDGDAIYVELFSAADVLEAGDIVQLEAQVFGPPGPGGIEPLLPVEWYDINYEGIGMAVGNGIVVVEAAANGGMKLDNFASVDPVFGTTHAPFMPGNDSGAIIVGAGAAPPPYGTQADLSRLSFSNYGSTVDLQGWGQAVRTTGYGQLYSAMGVDYFYTHQFAGTSSATPMVTAAAALLQSAYKEARGQPLSPAAIRSILRAGGTPQPGTSGAQPTQNIGPRPDADAAILDILDCNHNGIADFREIQARPEIDCNRNGVPDECEIGPVSFASLELAPLGAGFPQTFTITDPPAAGSDVAIDISAVGDLGFSSEYLSVALNGASLGDIFQTGAHDCLQAADLATIMVPAATWNASAQRGSVSIEITASAGVDAALCPAGSHVRVKVTYPPAASPDADGNGVLDVCERSSVPADLDGDGDVDGLDLASLLGAWGRCAPKAVCPADFNGDLVVNGLDLAVLLASWS